MIAFVARTVSAKRARLIGYAGTGTVLYASSIGLMATSVYLISRAALRPEILTLGILIAGTRYFAISRSVARYFERILSHSAVLGSLSHVRITVLRTLVPRFPQEESRFSSGEMLGKISTSMDDVQNFFLRLVGPLILLASTMLLVLFLGLAVQPLAAALIVAVMGVFGVAGARAARGAGMRLASSEQLARRRLQKSGGDLIRANEELFLAGTLESGLGNLAELSDSLESLGRRKLLRSANRTGAANLAGQLTFAAATFISILATRSLSLDPLMVAVMPMVAMAAFESVQTVAASASMAPWYLESAQELPIDPAAKATVETVPSDVALDITFSQVVISRGAGTTIGPLSFHVPSGSKCAIVGESGAGKTSVAYVILGYLRPASGDVRLAAADGRFASRLETEIGYVPENPAVLQSSLRSNLALSNPQATERQMAQALEMVSLEHLLTLKGGLDQILGGFATQLSGGERQRLALARLLLADFGTVILDEPTASLDKETALAVMKTTFEVFSGKTVLVITHQQALFGPFDQTIDL